MIIDLCVRSKRESKRETTSPNYTTAWRMPIVVTSVLVNAAVCKSNNCEHKLGLKVCCDIHINTPDSPQIKYQTCPFNYVLTFGVHHHSPMNKCNISRCQRQLYSCAAIIHFKCEPPDWNVAGLDFFFLNLSLLLTMLLSSTATTDTGKFRHQLHKMRETTWLATFSTSNIKKTTLKLTDFLKYYITVTLRNTTHLLYPLTCRRHCGPFSYLAV